MEQKHVSPLDEFEKTNRGPRTFFGKIPKLSTAPTKLDAANSRWSLPSFAKEIYFDFHDRKTKTINLVIIYNIFNINFFIASKIDVTEPTKWQMDGLGTELTALYAFLEGEREQEMCFLPGNDRSVILFDPANLESSATTRRINAIA
ncbi:hypothetical protein ALC62_02633 [Cyphomyrmex costatus]|uniref:Uncharacterized protein n=1 Tax=Cyphomyrmex costatus TaxID=456900 RepID=A0A195D2F0_9HYME|nr:hypothetical protein ALC62_02633 [Cyphomyrmex costatus]